MEETTEKIKFFSEIHDSLYLPALYQPILTSGLILFALVIYANRAWPVLSCLPFCNVFFWQAFMLRSYALTLSAVILPWYSFFFGCFWGWYNLNSYLWLANLVLVEI